MTISLRLADKDTQLIKAYAALHGMTVSELVRDAVMERIEDEYDLKAYDEAMAAYKNDSVKSLKKLDKGIARLITSWIRKNLEGCTDPRAHGKGLVANHSGQWRYRIGDYRLLCEIQDEQILILILEIGHRREIYK